MVSAQVAEVPRERVKEVSVVVGGRQQHFASAVENHHRRHQLAEPQQQRQQVPFLWQMKCKLDVASECCSVLAVHGCLVTCKRCRHHLFVVSAKISNLSDSSDANAPAILSYSSLLPFLCRNNTCDQVPISIENVSASRVVNLGDSS